jgi:hypothetical protein
MNFINKAFAYLINRPHVVGRIIDNGWSTEKWSDGKVIAIRKSDITTQTLTGTTPNCQLLWSNAIDVPPNLFVTVQDVSATIYNWQGGAGPQQVLANIKSNSVSWLIRATTNYLGASTITTRIEGTWK